jgi:hypothetical protein
MIEVGERISKLDRAAPPASRGVPARLNSGVQFPAVGSDRIEEKISANQMARGRSVFIGGFFAAWFLVLGQPPNGHGWAKAQGHANRHRENAPKNIHTLGSMPFYGLGSKARIWAQKRRSHTVLA